MNNFLSAGRRLVGTLLFASAIVVVADTAAAQIVRVGPLGGVRVQTRIGSVNVGPLGRVRVQAPGPVRPILPRRRAPAVIPPPPPLGAPTVQRPIVSAPRPRTEVVRPDVAPPRFAVPPYAELERRASLRPSAATERVREGRELQRAARQLRSDLEGHPQEDMWVGYLQPGAVESVAERWALGGPRAEVSREEIRGLLENFEGVAANPDLRSLSTMPGFVATQEGLIQIAVASGDQRAASSIRAPDQRGAVDPREGESLDPRVDRPIAIEPEPVPPLDTASEYGDIEHGDIDYGGIDSPERPGSVPSERPDALEDPDAYESIPAPMPDAVPDTIPDAVPAQSPSRVIRAEV